MGCDNNNIFRFVILSRFIYYRMKFLLHILSISLIKFIVSVLNEEMNLIKFWLTARYKLVTYIKVNWGFLFLGIHFHVHILSLPDYCNC